MYLCGVQNQRNSARLLYVYTASMLLERTRLFFLGESFEFKRFKAISQEGGASDCRPSNTDRPTTLSLFLAPAFSSSRLIPFRLLFSLLSPISVVTYCELLRELSRSARKRLSLSARKISSNMKNGADDQHACNTSRLVSS